MKFKQGQSQECRDVAYLGYYLVLRFIFQARNEANLHITAHVADESREWM